MRLYCGTGEIGLGGRAQIGARGRWNRFVWTSHLLALRSGWRMPKQRARTVARSSGGYFGLLDSLCLNSGCGLFGRVSFVHRLALLAHGSWGRATRQRMWPSARVPRDVARRRGLSWSCRAQGNTSLGSAGGRGVQRARTWLTGPFCRLLDMRRLWRCEGRFPVLDAQANTRHVADNYHEHVGVLARQQSLFRVCLRCRVRDALTLPSLYLRSTVQARK